MKTQLSKHADFVSALAFRNHFCIVKWNHIVKVLIQCCLGRLQNNITSFHSQFNSLSAVCDTTFVQLWILQLIHLLSDVMFSSCEQPLHPSDTLWCFYIPGSLFFYLYPLRWAMSPRQPSLAKHVDTCDTETHFFTHTHTELGLGWRLEYFINSVSDHMN